MYFQFETTRTRYHASEANSEAVTTVMFEGVEWPELQAVTNLPGGSTAFCIDYNELDSTAQNEIGGKVLAYAPIKKKWIPIER